MKFLEGQSRGKPFCGLIAENEEDKRCLEMWVEYNHKNNSLNFRANDHLVPDYQEEAAVQLLLVPFVIKGHD